MNRKAQNITSKSVTDLYILVVIFMAFAMYNCNDSHGSNLLPVIFLKPQYKEYTISTSKDTLNIPLNNNTYNNIKSLNVFNDNGKEYLSFYDGRSKSISIYSLSPVELIKITHLNSLFDNSELLKTAVYSINFDTIFVASVNKFSILDSSGKMKQQISLPDPEKKMLAYVGSDCPPKIAGNKIYTAIRPNIRETSLKAVENWKPIYEFDLDSKSAKRVSMLPDFYGKGYYGDHYMKYNFCVNEKGNIILSFWADSLIYAYDDKNGLQPYLGKSLYQSKQIHPLGKEALNTDAEAKKFLTQDCYGPIFFDSYNKRYYRAFYPKISENDYTLKKWERQKRLIIFDEDLRIVGEVEVKDLVSLSDIFFSDGGSIYARINPTDEYTVHFLKIRCVNL